MNPRDAQGKAGIASFRGKLLVAMMLVVFTITALVLYFAQHRVEADLRRDLERQFQSELGFLLGAQEERRAAIAARCRTLARSVRIRAAFEEDEYSDLYLNAAVELRDVLPNDAELDSDARSPRAEFFCFLNAAGLVISPPDAAPQEQWKQQLAVKGGAVTQQIGYIVLPDAEVREVIVTPIITTDTGDVIGALVLGFKPIEIA
ncbi:MAG TPA: hypothetical protein VFD27_10970, partial [Chthoniobacteraceae bacterium]|nr:hypothetical protein [Chthoniobacteraceae bacterium]